MQTKTKKKIVIALVWLSGLLDLGTFWFTNLHEFEANPLFLATKSYFLVICLKFLVLLGISWMIWQYKLNRKGTYAYAYIICFICLYAVVGQVLGAYSNLSVHNTYTTSEPGTVVPMDPEVAAATYFNYQIFVLYLPMLVGTMTFLLFEQLFLNEIKKELPKKVEYDFKRMV